jgi:hypothetical protein
MGRYMVLRMMVSTYVPTRRTDPPMHSLPLSASVHVDVHEKPARGLSLSAARRIAESAQDHMGGLQAKQPDGSCAEYVVVDESGRIVYAPAIHTGRPGRFVDLTWRYRDDLLALAAQTLTGERG